ncbi:hypothetical protein GCM10023084_79510 [Streptomyces lacrimifluminis]|uniref:Uncharacterized protein n=1 Tax=Streptomyces lacrimifluminis TaxID=1500077 RepID=A0A917PBP2_9ACTN|nr:hypothetical protein [Streptomyces lacrimifluminis]GGJ70052.1 hypothetical protein GCM10012282_78640 [Streptomyces lacrimifluminis]
MLYETAQGALEQLTDDQILERVALWVLRKRYPNLRPTSATGDTGLDGYSQPLFEDGIDVALWVSLQSTWSAKLTIELKKHKKHGRTAPAFFVTNRSTNEIKKGQERERAKTEFGVDLEIVDLAELVTELESDSLRWVAEAELGVRPRQPRALSTAEMYLERLSGTVPGMTAELHGTTEIQDRLRTELGAESPATRIVVVEGPGGSGKTRLAIEAARSVATTLVVPSGAPLTPEAFSEVGLDGPLILVVDDAHRSESLSAVAAMLADPRFDRVRLLFTLRPGERERTLYAAGAEQKASAPVVLGRLERLEIDRIITDHGIHHEEFRNNVINLAVGNPLLAHAACQVALTSGTFGWADASELLRNLVANRLVAMDDPSLHRAVAVALALLTRAGDLDGHHGGRDVAVLHGAVSGLPSEPDRLDRLLDNLVDAGLVDTPPYTFRPELAAVVLVAAALTQGAPVRLDTRTALQQLAAQAGISSGSTPQENAEALGSAAQRLGPPIAVLADAARSSGNQAAGAAIAQFVLGLLPEDASLGHWTSVVHLAYRAAPADQSLLVHLAARLARQWPVPASGQLWDDEDASAHYRFELDKLCEEFARLARRTDPLANPAAVAAVLDIAWLADAVRPAFGDGQPGALLRTFETWSAPRNLHAGGCEALTTSRGALLDAISRWARDRAAEPPLGLDPEDAAKRGPQSFARVLLAALQPFLNVTAERVRYGTPEQANTFNIRIMVLPDVAATRDQLNQALDLLAPLLMEQVLSEPEHRHLLNALVALPRQLRQTAALGLPGSTQQPLPAYADQTLTAAASRFASKIAEHWTGLPLSVRRRAAEAALGMGRWRTDLTAAAAAGEPVAAAALADQELANLLVVQPPHTFSGAWQEDIAAQKPAAVALASALTTAQAVDLLEATDPDVSGTAHEVLPAFAAAVGENATDTISVLARLARSPLAAEAALLAGLAHRHPEQVWQWVSERTSDTRIAGLALAMVDDHPDHEEPLLHTLVEAATGTENAESAAICEQVAHHLWHCTRSADDRLARLGRLGTRGPEPAVPAVLVAIGMVLLPGPQVAASAVAECSAVLDRMLAAEHLSRGLNDYLAADAAMQIARRVPERFANVLVGHIRQGHPLPTMWAEYIERLGTEVRDEITAAFVHHWSTAPITAPDEAAESLLRRAFTQIGRDTGAWSRTLYEWASGAPSARRRAAEAIQSAWSTATWEEIVPALLTARLDPESQELLLHGLTSVDGAFTDPASVISPRREAAEKLQNHPDTVVQDFAAAAVARLDSFSSTFQDLQNRARNGYLQ